MARDWRKEKRELVEKLVNRLQEFSVEDRHLMWPGHTRFSPYGLRDWDREEWNWKVYSYGTNWHDQVPSIWSGTHVKKYLYDNIAITELRRAVQCQQGGEGCLA